MERDEHIFAYVMNELENGVKNEALWIKAFSVAEGDENKHKALYLQYRVEEIKSVFKNNNIDYIGCSKDKVSKYIENDFKDELSPEWMRKLWEWADKYSIPDLDNSDYCSGLARTMDKLIKQDVLHFSDENKIISELPKEIGNLINLEKIDIFDTNISSIPKDIGKLSNLEELDLGRSKKLKILPKEIGKLTNLKKLSITGSSLILLPKEIGNLGKLEKLFIIGCDNLTEIPKEIGKLSNLEELDLGDNKKLEILPKEIGKLTKLKTLNFCCYAGQGFVDCTSFKSFPKELSNLTNLKSMYIDSTNEKDIPDELFDMAELSISGGGEVLFVIKESKQ